MFKWLEWHDVKCGCLELRFKVLVGVAVGVADDVVIGVVVGVAF